MGKLHIHIMHEIPCPFKPNFSLEEITNLLFYSAVHNVYCDDCNLAIHNLLRQRSQQRKIGSDKLALTNVLIVWYVMNQCILYNKCMQSIGNVSMQFTTADINIFIRYITIRTYIYIQTLIEFISQPLSIQLLKRITNKLLPIYGNGIPTMLYFQ